MDHHSASESFMKHLDNEVMNKFLKIFLPGSKFEDIVNGDAFVWNKRQDNESLNQKRLSYHARVRIYSKF